MTTDPHTLTGAYAIGALTEAETVLVGRHLEQCEECALEVRELRETAARLALAVAEVPPAALRDKVMAQLPRTRQLPPDQVLAAPAPTSRSRWRHRLPNLVAAACLALAAVAGGVAVHDHQEAARQHTDSVRAERRASELSGLLTAPDATFRTSALKAGGGGTVVLSRRLGRAAFVYHDLPRLPDRRVYELWYRRGGAMVPAGLVRAGSASGTKLLEGGPAGAAGVGVTAEPAGGSAKPTSPPLALLPI